ncbi:hypothetical protein [Streptomyces sp. B6B3]|jgi:hypothetical protein|uniref:hypothetical protein n=1 Tax=Streptomyces sp. B6B3 TaxID=3153570 RepID=UPI00325EC735
MSQPRRVRITSPQTRIALARRHRPAQHLRPPPLPGAWSGNGDGSADDEATTAAARALFARQRRLALRTLSVLGLLLFGLSGLLGVLPALDDVTVLDIPASWLLLMTASYPLLLLIAVLHVRAAERIERGPKP